MIPQVPTPDIQQFAMRQVCGSESVSAAAALPFDSHIYSLECWGIPQFTLLTKLRQLPIQPHRLSARTRIDSRRFFERCNDSMNSHFDAGVVFCDMRAHQVPNLSENCDMYLLFASWPRVEIGPSQPHRLQRRTTTD